MNTAALLALIADLYSQIQTLLAQKQALEERVSRLDAELAHATHTHGPDGEHHH